MTPDRCPHAPPVRNFWNGDHADPRVWCGWCQSNVSVAGNWEWNDRYHARYGYRPLGDPPPGKVAT